MCERVEEPKMTEHPPEIEGYRCFINNPDNSHRCDICPHNIGCKVALPCGQYHCWVDLHTTREDHGQ